MPLILVVDDHEPFRELLRQALEVEGYEARMAADAREALNVLEAEDVDVILLDYDMPEMNGAELLAKLRADEATADLPIIGMSGVELDPAEARAFTSFLHKPLNARDVLFLLAQVAPLR